jgi:prepilin-type N-terminal cleavage/methylation domain-containing protein
MKVMNTKNIAGFTIAELLVVIALVGILAVMVMVNFRSGEHSNNLRQAGTALLQDLRLAQNYTIGGSSLNYCSENESFPDDFGLNCEGDAGCSGVVDSCVNGVPLGGYGINIASTENYTVFADTNNNQELDGSTNRKIIFRDISLKGIHIIKFKLGSQEAVTPSSDNYLNILFEPPQGTVHFFVKLDEVELSDSQETLASMLISSDYVSGSCRKVTINRISGQISESQSGCSF